MTVVYFSQTGFTRTYAEAYAKKKNLECYSTKKASRKIKKGSDICYFGSIKYGKVSHYQKISKKFNVKELCAVGLDTDIIKRETELKKQYSKTVFYFVGGINIKGLKGFNKIIMKIVLGKIKKNYKENPTEKLKEQLTNIENGLDRIDLSKLSKIY